MSFFFEVLGLFWCQAGANCVLQKLCYAWRMDVTCEAETSESFGHAVRWTTLDRDTLVPAEASRDC